MQLSQIKADIRLRSPWEAVDLGFAMVQAWWKILYLPWVIFAVIFAFILWQVVPDDRHWLAAILFWWCKPFYDRLLLYIGSQELFSLRQEAQGRLQVLKKLPTLLRKNGLFSALTYRRFSLSRGLNLPIWQLEGLKGVVRKKRQRLLHINAHSQAVWLTITCIHIEIIVYLAFFGLVLLWLPSEMQTEFFATFFLEQNSVEAGYWVDLLSYIFYVSSVVLIEPFYVLGSFGLYLNRRTQLEAWDIELVFRHMATRLARLKDGKDGVMPEAGNTMSRSLPSLFSAFLLALAVFNVSVNNIVYADDDEPVASQVLPANQSKETIEALMKTDVLSHTETFSFWRLKDWDTLDETNLDTDVGEFAEFVRAVGRLIAVVFEFGLWVLLAIVIAILIRYRAYWQGLFQGTTEQTEKKSKPDVLFGLDIRPESLPDDIAAVARRFWQQGQQREALSLLYRGSLMRLVNQDDIQLEDSHTEGDVIRLSRQVLDQQREVYFEKLTQVWQRAAYAHRFPNDEKAEYLFQYWETAFPIHVIQHGAGTEASV